MHHFLYCSTQGRDTNALFTNWFNLSLFSFGEWTFLLLAKVTLQHLKVGWPAAYWHRGWWQPRPSPLGRSGVGLLLFLLLHSLSPATSFPWWRPLNFFSLNICVLLPTAGRSTEDPQENGKSVHEFYMQLNERRLK